MNVKKVLAFLGIFILMVVFYYFYEYKGGELRQEREELGKKALVFSPDSLESFLMVAREEGSAAADTVSLSLARGRWRLSYPVATDADSQAVARLLSSAAGASLNRVVEDSAGDLSIFGLDEPRLVLELRTRDAKTPLRLCLGNKNPTGSYLYAADGTRPARVILLNSWLLSDLNKSPQELRDKKVLHFENDQAKKLILETAGGEILCLEREEDDWQLREPLVAPADRDSVEAILKELQEAEAESFIDDPAEIDLKNFGLSAPLLTVKLYQQDDQAVRLLYLGKRQSGDGPYYARREGEENVFLVEDDLVKRLTPEVSILRDRRLVRAAKDAITRFRLVYPDRSVTALKSGTGDWSLTEPDTSRADGGRVDGLLWSLKELEAVSFIEHPGKSLLRAFENPFLVLEYQTGDSGAFSGELKFAGNPDQDSLVFVRESAPGGQVAVVDAEKARDLMKDPNDLRYKKVLEFDTEEITRIRLEYPQDTLELVKKEDKWLLASGGNVEITSWKAQNLLWDLAGMEFNRLVGPPADRVESLGLERPVLRVSLWSEGKEPYRKVAFADSIPGRDEMYLSVEGDNRLFAVEKRIYGSMPKSAEELRKEE